jgi:pilus assembly protein Flp/PilA
MKSIASRRENRRGQAIAEYLILIALVAVGSIAILQVLSSNLQNKLADVSDSVAGFSKESNRKGIKAKEEHYQIRDLGDFKEAIQDNEGK